MVFRTSGFSVGGATMPSHFSMIPSSIVKSSSTVWPALVDDIIHLSSGRVLSFAVSCLICCSLIADAWSVLVM